MSIGKISHWQRGAFDKHYNVVPPIEMTKKPHVIERAWYTDPTLHFSLDEFGILSPCNQPQLTRHTGT